MLTSKDKVEVWNAAYGTAFALEESKRRGESSDLAARYKLIAAIGITVASAAVKALEEIER